MNKISPKTHLLIANIVMGIGAVFAAVEILVFDLMYAYNSNQPLLLILAASFFLLGLVYRFVFVKCPYCHDKLLGGNKIPAVCPSCGGDLKNYDPKLVQDAQQEAQPEQAQKEDA